MKRITIKDLQAALASETHQREGFEDLAKEFREMNEGNAAKIRGQLLEINHLETSIKNGQTALTHYRDIIAHLHKTAIDH